MVMSALPVHQFVSTLTQSTSRSNEGRLWMREQSLVNSLSARTFRRFCILTIVLFASTNSVPNVSISCFGMVVNPLSLSTGLLVRLRLAGATERPGPGARFRGLALLDGYVPFELLLLFAHHLVQVLHDAAGPRGRDRLVVAAHVDVPHKC